MQCKDEILSGNSSKRSSLDDSYEKSAPLKSDLNCNPISDLNLIFFPAFSFNIINNNEIDKMACTKLDMLKDKDTRVDFSSAECTLLTCRCCAVILKVVVKDNQSLTRI